MPEPVALSIVPTSASIPPKHFELTLGGDDHVRIGRAPENHVVFKLPGVSWLHAELKLQAPAPTGDGDNGTNGVHGAPTVVVRDLSTNGTGVKQSSEKYATRLPKDADTPLQSGAVLVLPMRVKHEDGKTSDDFRCEFAVHIGKKEVPADAATQPAASEPKVADSPKPPSPNAPLPPAVVMAARVASPEPPPTAPPAPLAPAAPP